MFHLLHNCQYVTGPRKRNLLKECQAHFLKDASKKHFVLVLSDDWALLGSLSPSSGSTSLSLIYKTPLY